MMDEALPLTGATDTCRWIEVSPEMTALIGDGRPGGIPMPANPVRVTFSLGSDIHQPAVWFGGAERGCSASITLFVSQACLLRLAGRLPKASDQAGYYLPSELRAIAMALRDGHPVPAARSPYQLAKSIELLCETVAHLGKGTLVPLAADRGLSAEDTRRVLEARRMIDERWSEKLTLDSIARACGLNRAKLTRGFKDLFDCTVAEALAEQRLMHAGRMLLTTNKPVSSIGYENGYLNNASFARAFSRRFGVAPSSYRMNGVAA